jgi:hypothetical protein
MGAIFVGIVGCLSEANFRLLSESRLPNFLKAPKEVSRNDFDVTIDYYIRSGKRLAVFKLYKKNGFFMVKKVTGILRDPPPKSKNHMAWQE